MPNDDFPDLLLRHVEAHRPTEPPFPDEGLVLVNVRIDHAGMLLDAHVERSSGVERLDVEALALIRSSAPFPKVPLELADPFETVVPIRFPAPDPAFLACLTVTSASATFVSVALVSPNGCAAGQPVPDRVQPGG
jgi:TonB family protein